MVPLFSAMTNKQHNVTLAQDNKYLLTNTSILFMVTGRVHHLHLELGQMASQAQDIKIYYLKK